MVIGNWKTLVHNRKMKYHMEWEMWLEYRRMLLPTHIALYVTDTEVRHAEDQIG